MAMTFSLSQISGLKGRKIFVDANILIYLYWPTGSLQWEQNYSTAFGHLLRQNNELHIDFLVISEIINRVLRIEHSKINPAQKFKDFRDSQEGKDALSDIYYLIKNEVLTRFKVKGKEFSGQEIENLLVLDSLDFVDKATVSLCKENSFVLLTNDRDFKNADLDILTGNPRILRR